MISMQAKYYIEVNSLYKIRCNYGLYHQLIFKITGKSFYLHLHTYFILKSQKVHSTGILMIYKKMNVVRIFSCYSNQGICILICILIIFP